MKARAISFTSTLEPIISPVSHHLPGTETETFATVGVKGWRGSYVMWEKPFISPPLDGRAWQMLNLWVRGCENFVVLLY